MAKKKNTSSSKSTSTSTTKTVPVDAKAVTKLLTTGLQNVQSLPDTYTPQQERALITPALLGGQTLADMYGVTYDRQAIQDILDNATNTAYRQRFNEQQIAEDNFYQQLESTAATQYAQARKDRGAAILSGASAGARAANQLSNMLGVSQNTTQTLTDLAQQRKAIADELATAIAANAASAINTANSAGLGLLEFDVQHEANQEAQYAADSDYNAQVATNNANANIARAQNIANLLGNYLTAGATMQASETSANATRYAADQNLAGTKYAADTSAASQLRAARIGANAGQGTGKGTQTSSTNKTPQGTTNKGTGQHLTNRGYPDSKSGSPLSTTDAYYPDFLRALMDNIGASIANTPKNLTEKGFPNSKSPTSQPKLPTLGSFPTLPPKSPTLGSFPTLQPKPRLK